ncbi:peroxiredoxin [Haliangium ochraceum]|uniref:thioredoxin-dependent peroxiredoxin n=1 Tax=Haliangium ochraceum (strain DSM 14365 / JCM 11303 / SMP-2) TaxID=502025 RepID=D0LYW1_HALO1|nr:peroxiredoxin [Haliangium ochraceum]ACY14431.1 alkyl hydroperoxide reductase/ Thiol specific antioxidant/ Mal allergen [Haliangium ochraceum DSM 14365]
MMEVYDPFQGVGMLFGGLFSLLLLFSFSRASIALAIVAFFVLGGCSKSEDSGAASQAEVVAEIDKLAPEGAEPGAAQAAEAVAMNRADDGAELLAVGAPAPDFTAPTHDGTSVQLSALRGQPVVLYFYPKDETPGCTAEAQAFRDEMPAFEKLDATVIGVSLDSVESHKAFADNHSLNFPLAADPDGAIAAKYGVDTSRGVAARVTYLIAADGTVAAVFPEVRVDGHADEVLAALQAME